MSTLIKSSTLILAGASLLVGSIIGGGSVYWYQSRKPIITHTVKIPGPVRIVTKRIVVYKHQIVAAREITCGTRKILVTAILKKRRDALTSKKYFRSDTVHIHVSPNRAFISLHQRFSGSIGYAASIGGMGGSIGGNTGISIGLRDRFARVGPVRLEAEAFNIGTQAIVRVDARIPF